MSRRKVAYAKKNCIDPEEEGEELPFAPREITIKKDKWVTKEYNIGNVLGRGKFGEVKKCDEKSTGLKLAAKFIAVQCDWDKSAVTREIELQSTLHHTKVLQLYDAFEKGQQMCIVMELVEGGELFDRVVDPKFDLTERVAILFMRQIVDGLAFIHSHHIIHLDMKPENVVCVATTGTRIKIIDFGLALRYDTGCSVKTMAGTLEFMAPEVANFEDVSPATDMWSVGVICYVLVSGLSPFVGDNDNETTSNILRCTFDFDAEEFEAITDGCKDFIRKLLVKKPNERLKASECMKHSWLQRITRAQTTRHLSKKFHVKFFARRKWKKVISAILAINRLEKCSVKYMKKKSDGLTHSAHNSPSGARKGASTHNSPSDVRKGAGPPAAEQKYDWRANIEARKKQREAKLEAASTNDAQVNRTKPRVGRIPIDRWQKGETTPKAPAATTAIRNSDHTQPARSPNTPRRRNRIDDITEQTNNLAMTRQQRLAAFRADKR